MRHKNFHYFSWDILFFSKAQKKQNSLLFLNASQQKFINCTCTKMSQKFFSFTWKKRKINYFFMFLSNIDLKKQWIGRSLKEEPEVLVWRYSSIWKLSWKSKCEMNDSFVLTSIEDLFQDLEVGLWMVEGYWKKVEEIQTLIYVENVFVVALFWRMKNKKYSEMSQTVCRTWVLLYWTPFESFQIWTKIKWYQCLVKIDLKFRNQTGEFICISECCFGRILNVI